jgi:sarcosine oxidase subunit beta
MFRARGQTDRYKIAIIGAGVQGLSLAYNLAKLGQNDVVVFEKSYLGSGATTRCGGMIRAAYWNPELCNLLRESVQLWEQLSAELGYNVMFIHRPGFTVASTEPELESYKDYVNMHHSCGLHTRILDSAETMKLVPYLNEREVTGAVFDPTAGIARHDAVVWAYARAAPRLGVSIHPQTEVQAIRVNDGCVRSVKTSQGEVQADIVVNAAGGYDKQVAQMAGVELPTVPQRLEATVTESIKPFLSYFRWYKGELYANQTSRGEIVAGVDSVYEVLSEPTAELRCSLAHMRRVSQVLTSLFPSLERLAILRQWAGLVSVSDDGCPILGPVPEVEGFILDCAWLVGFMAAPSAGQALAQSIVEQKMPKLIEPFKRSRFAEGKPISHASVSAKFIRLARSNEVSLPT